MRRVTLVALAAAVVLAVPGSGDAGRSTRMLIDCACYDIVRLPRHGQPTMVFKNAGQNLLAVSRDQRRVAYAGADRRLYVSRIDGTRPRLIDRRRPHWAAFAPNGKRIAYGVDGCGVCIARVDGRRRRRLRVRGARGPLAWAPDSRRIAFVVSRRRRNADAGVLTIANANGSGRRALVFGRFFWGRSSVGVKMAWSPRGNRLAYLAGSRTKIHVLRLSDKRQLAAVTGRAPVWSPTGRRLAYSTGFRVAVMKFNGRRRHLLDGLSVDPYGSGVSWSPSGRWIAYARYSTQERYELATATFDGRKRRVLTSESRNVEIGPTYWSRDGKAILYTTFLQQGE